MIRRRETALLKIFQIPDPVPIPSLGETQGRKSEHRLDAKEEGEKNNQPQNFVPRT